MAEFDNWDRLVEEANKVLRGEPNNITSEDLRESIEQLQSVIDGSSYALMRMSSITAQRIALLERENAALRQELQKLKSVNKMQYFD